MIKCKIWQLDNMMMFFLSSVKIDVLYEKIHIINICTYIYIYMCHILHFIIFYIYIYIYIYIIIFYIYIYNKFFINYYFKSYNILLEMAFPFYKFNIYIYSHINTKLYIRNRKIIYNCIASRCFKQHFSASIVIL